MTRAREFGARVAPGLLFAALVLAVYADPVFTGRNFSGRDLIAYNLPMEKSIHDAYGRGRLPVWSAGVSGGRPLAPNPNAGALYPVRILLSPLPFPLAMRLYPVLHWIAAGLGVLALLLTLGRSRAAAWVGAATYAFSGVSVAELFFPHIQPGMTLLPWILWAVARPAAAPWRRVLPLGFLFALDLLAADVFTCGLAIGSAVLWILFEQPQPARARALAVLAAGVALGALAAAPQILATMLWIPFTNRAVLGMKLADTIYFSIHPLRLLELVIPYPFGDAWDMTNASLWGWSLFRGRPLGIFNTLYCGAFAVMALVWTRQSREPGARFSRWLLAAAVALSVPAALLPLPWAAGIASPVPLRNPEKLAVAFVLGLAILAAIAFDRLRTDGRSRRGALAVGAGLALAAAGAYLLPDAAARVALGVIGGDPAAAGARARASLPGALAEAGLLWMASLWAADRLWQGRRRAVAAAALVLTLVPIAANRPIARTFSEAAVFGPTAFARHVAKSDPAGDYRTLGESFFLGPSALAQKQSDGTLIFSDLSRRAWTHHAATLWERGTVINEDFDVGDLSRTESLRRLSGMATGFRDSEAFFGTLGLRYGIRFRDQTTPIAGYERVGGDLLQDWDEHRRAYPDVRLLERWRETPGAVEALRAIPQLGHGEIVLETGEDRAGAARGGTVRAVEKTPERMVLDLDLPQASWLFVLRAFWPYRTLELDGSPVDAVPAQLGFSGVPIPAGRSRLVWREELPGIGISRWGPLLFGMIVAGLLVAHSRRRTT